MSRLEQIDLNLLLALHWLLHERNVTRAARRLATSQSAMSRNLARLRELLSDPVLVRLGNTMQPSPRATALQPQVASMVASLRELFAEASPFSPELAEGVFRVACTDYTAALVADAWRRSVTANAPRLDVQLLPLTEQTALDLAVGRVDLAFAADIGHIPAAATGHLQSLVIRHVFDEDFVSVVRVRHALAGKRIGLKAFARLPHILTTPGGGATGVVDAALDKLGYQRRIAYRVGSFLLAASLVTQTDCVATLPRRLVGLFPRQLAVIHPKLELEGFGIRVGWHPTRTNEARHRWVRDRICQHLARATA